MRHVSLLPALLLLPLAAAHCAADAPPPPPVVVASPPPVIIAPRGPRPPETAKLPKTTTYHGVAVTDDYAWLEDGKDPKVQAWSDQEDLYARAKLASLTDRPAIKKRVTALVGEDAPSYGEIDTRGKTLFVMKTQPPKQQPFLVTVASSADPATEKVLLDPNVVDTSGGTAIDFFVPSRDGKRVAVSLSKGGSESGDVHVYDVATGAELAGDMIPRVNGGTAGGSLAWAGDGFFYTRYPHAGERPPADLGFFQQVYFHKLGTPTSADTYAIGKDFPRIVEVDLESSPDGKVVLARAANGDGGEFAYYVHREGPKGGTWTQLSTYADKVVDAKFAPNGTLYLLSHAKPRGQILRLPYPTAPLAKATVAVPESDAVIESFVATPNRLYVTDLVGGPSRVRIIPPLPRSLASCPHPGKTAALTPASPPRCTEAVASVPILPVSHVSATARVDGDDILFRDESYLEPPGWYRFSAATGELAKTALSKTTHIDLRDAEVVRESCVSADGTKVPINIVQLRGARRDGSGYAMLTGYGGFSISRSPRFRPLTRMLLDQGFAVAEANLRGGGEFGDAWHEDGSVTKKQHVFDDFYACAKLLRDEKVASPAHLAIQGGSNGGLLMGAAMVEHPEAYRVVVSHVGIYDMLNLENTSNGAFNVTEYGSTKDPAQFKALYAYSPYHHVVDGAHYPSVLFLTGANDPRVDPYNSRKMTARLQAANASDNPILLRTSHDTGHGMGTPLAAEIDEDADVYAFMFHELGIGYRAPGKTAPE
jgi:prolyl oligopeptidase